MATADEISRSIRAQLKVIDPDISADPLTPERKIIDTVAEVIAESQGDQFVLNYQFDIDTKVGTDLDKFVAIFGFARQSGSSATGTITFSVDSAATNDIFIPAGTQISTTASTIANAVTFITTTSVTLFRGTLSVEAPIQCTNVGTIGNVPASTIIAINAATSTQVSSIINNTATTGGQDQETDAQLRVRFKNTIFRNISGTKDQFLALAVASNFTNRARVITPIDRFTEYVQIPASLSVTSTIPYSKYSYTFDYYLTNPITGANEIFFNPGIDFTFNSGLLTNTTAPPTVTILQQDSTRGLVVGGVLALEHSYCSTNSRNIPASGVANYVDVYVSGNNTQDAFESAAFPASGTNIFTSSNASSATYTANFKRLLTGSTPLAGNIFQKLLWNPVISLPSSLTVNGNTFFQGSDYYLVTDNTNTRGSRRAQSGIEWSSSVALAIGYGTTYTLDYEFNKLILTLNELMDNYKQVATDVLVHQANLRYFNVNLIAMYDPGSTTSAVNANITAAITDLFNKLDFGAIVQFSDIIEIAHEVTGVDNIRFARSSDDVPYGIQEVAPDGTTLISIPYTSDFFLNDIDLPVLNSVTVTQRAANTFSL